MIEVLNIRKGFANNSSSDHCLLFDGREEEDVPEEHNGSFGWDKFVLASQHSKERYFLALFLQNRPDFLPKPLYQAILKSYYGVNIDVKKSIKKFAEHYGVDHNSMVSFPNNFHYDIPDKEFVKDFFDYLSQDKIVIYGGNDNDGVEHQEQSVKLNNTFWETDSVCRKEHDSDVWTIFNRHSGDKIKFKMELGRNAETLYDTENSRNDAQTVMALPKAYTPELVDVKITDICHKNCPWCYQNSTSKGKHANSSWIEYKLIPALSKLKVFEVAIGGGEPTLHPQFASILQGFRESKIIPNFTTATLKWIEKPIIRKAVREYCGSFAYTVTDSRQVDALIESLKKYDMPFRKASAQVVMGVTDRETFKEIYRACGKYKIGLNLLGFKTFGRGATGKFEINDYSWWLDELETLNRTRGLGNPYSITADTVLIQQFAEEVSKKFPKFLYYAEDGKFSCYIDAVEGILAPSSFTEQIVKIDMNVEKTATVLAEDIRVHFSNF